MEECGGQCHPLWSPALPRKKVTGEVLRPENGARMLLNSQVINEDIPYQVE